MITVEEINEKMTELPEVIQDHLYDEEIADLNDEIIIRNGVEKPSFKVLFGLINELVVKEVPLADLLDEVKKRFGYDDAKAKKLATDIAGYRLLPLNGFLGDVDGYIKTLGGNPADYPSTRLQVQEKTTDAAVQDVEDAVSVGDLPHRLKSRFEDAVRSYFKGVRTESQLIDILTREEKIGGVGLPMDAAQSVIREAQEEKKSVLIEDVPVGGKTVEGVGSSGSSEEGTMEDAEAAPAPEKPKDTFVTVRPEDEEEIDQIKKNLPSEEQQKSASTDAKIKASVDEIFKAAGVGAGSSESLQARFKKIIENRLRDIRDELETLEVLVQPKELGGMALTEEAARKVLGLIEAKLKGVHERHQEAVKEKKAEWVAQEAEKAIARVESEKSAEAMARDEAFRQATARSKKIVTPPPARPTPPPNLPVPPGNAAAPVPHALPNQMARTAPSGTPKVAMQAGEISTPPVMKQPPVTPVRPASPVPMPASKPVMADIKPSTPMATGPVEELRTTSLEDFRRLSKDPKEATLKIKDKIDLLGEDSFSKRSEGIAAWNQSGVFSLYLEMMAAALEGKPMEEVIASRQAEKKPYLTKEEIDAIVQLGAVLRA